jgi:hypothetical protein
MPESLVLQQEQIAAAVVTTVTTPKVPPDCTFVVYSVLAMDLTTAISTAIEIGIQDGTKCIPIDSTPGSFAAGTSHTIYWPCILQEGQAIYAKFSTPTAGDRLVVNAFGLVNRTREGHVSKEMRR